MFLKGKQKSQGRATSRIRSQSLIPVGRENVTQINVCIANKQTHDKHKDQLKLDPLNKDIYIHIFPVYVEPTTLKPSTAC